MDFNIRKNQPSDTDDMFMIWESSVIATHHFLSKDDIQKIGLQVKEYLKTASFEVITDGSDKALGFMGMTSNKIDSLFIDPAHFGKGLGKRFILFAKNLHPDLLVDVNEDNNQAKVFYEKMGFIIYHRSELDDDGRPFPILKMKT